MTISDITKIDASDTGRLLRELNWTEHSSQGRHGALIRELYRQGEPARRVALVRFKPGSSAPAHRHTSFETIYVLDGEFTDEFGEHRQGEIVLYQPGSEHTWTSSSGATLFVVWDGPTEVPGPGA
jgi:anti-sigma factor ChrR (cupin superfamily)